MKRPLALTLLAGLLLVLSGCGADNPVPPTSVSGTPTPVAQATATAPATTPTAAANMPQAELVSSLSKGCYLLGSRDVAKVMPFPDQEVMKPEYKSQQASHPVFSAENLAVKEYSCVFYVFYHANFKDNQMDQVTYWVDVPDRPAASQAAQVWASAKSKAARDVPGVGDEAFYDSGHNGRLSFTKDGLYLTVEVLGTNLDATTPAGVEQQVSMEKSMALAMLTRFK